MKADGWVSLVLRNRECIVLKFDNGIFMNEGYILSDAEILTVFGNRGIGNVSDGEEMAEVVEEGIVDLDHGSRYEGRVLKEGRIPFGYGEMYDDDGFLVYKGIMINWKRLFGYGEMYDDDGFLVYKGIMINWKRFGYGTSYHNHGAIEYEGYWCDNKRFGRGKVYDRRRKLIKDCCWWNGCESEVNYEGDGSNLNIKVTCLHLLDNCILNAFNISMFLNLNSVKIGNDCFYDVKTFRIEGMSELKRIMIGFNAFTQKKNYWGNDTSKSFHILDCESLESIEIGDYSFSDFGGDFELKNLPALELISIGYCGSDSFNFFESPFELKGRRNWFQFRF